MTDHAARLTADERLDIQDVEHRIKAIFIDTISTPNGCLAVIARTDPNDQESVVLLPELDGAHGP